MLRLKRLGYFLCFALVLGLLLQLDKGSGTIDKLVKLTWLAFMLLGSAFAVVSIWRKRGTRRKSSLSQIAFLPLSWQRWILDEDQLPKDPRSRR